MFFSKESCPSAPKQKRFRDPGRTSSRGKKRERRTLIRVSLESYWKSVPSNICRRLSHPTGRLLPRRRGHPLEVDRVIRAARDLGRILEGNGQPDRLDLACRRAKEAGVMVAISSDAHGARELEHLEGGVDQARRGWLEPGDVVNTLSLPDLLLRLRKTQ